MAPSTEEIVESCPAAAGFCARGKIIIEFDN